MGRKSSTLLFFTALCGAFCLCYLDRFLFSIDLTTFFAGPEFSFQYFFGVGSVVFWWRILRLIFAFATGFLFYLILNRKKHFLLLTWIFWQACIYFIYLIRFENPLWFAEDPITFFWRMFTIVPFFLGTTLAKYLLVLGETLSSNVAKLAVIGLGIVAVILNVVPYVRIITSDGYRAAREFQVEIPTGAKSVHKRWNTFDGTRTVTFKIEMVDPDSLVNDYDRKLNWDIMPDFVYDEERGWQIRPGSEWQWKDVTREELTHRDIRGYGLVAWIDYEDDIYLIIGIRSKREDPQNLYEVTLSSGPAFWKERVGRLKIK